MLKLWGNVDADAAAGSSPTAQGAAFPFFNIAADKQRNIYRGFPRSLSVQISDEGLQLSSKDCSHKSSSSNPAGNRLRAQQYALSILQYLQEIFSPPLVWFGNTRNKICICSFLFPTRKKSTWQCCCPSKTNPNPCPRGSHAGLATEAVITRI